MSVMGLCSSEDSIRGSRNDDMTTFEVYDSAHRRSPAYEELKGVIRYRDLIVQLISRSLKIRYKRSILGIGWTMLNPLLMMLVLTFVFSNIFRFAVEGYAVYVLSGLILWNFFSQTTTSAMNEMVYGGALFGRIYVPKAVFPVSAIGTGLVNWLFALVPLLVVMILSDVPIRPSLLFVPLPMILTAVFALGVALLLSSFAVYFPDLVPMYEVLSIAWMYATPIIYPVDILPEELLWVVKINPMAYMVEAFRQPIFAGTLPSLQVFGMAALWAIGALAIGWWSFSRRANDYAYRI